jgi:hypothetical protein
MSAKERIQEALQEYPSQKLSQLGMRPAWLIKDAPDMNSELLMVLTKLHSYEDFNFLDEIQKIARGVEEYQYLEDGHTLNGMYLSWRNIWHNWGNNQAYALLEAYKITRDSTLLWSTKLWADNFIPFLINQNYPFEITVSFDGSYEVKNFPQIAYGINSIYQGLKSLAELTQEERYQKFSENVFSWFKGENVARTIMYQEETVRGYDGISEGAVVNYNSGAESTIECLMAILRRGSF